MLCPGPCIWSSRLRWQFGDFDLQNLGYILNTVAMPWRNANYKNENIGEYQALEKYKNENIAK